MITNFKFGRGILKTSSDTGISHYPDIVFSTEREPYSCNMIIRGKTRINGVLYQCSYVTNEFEVMSLSRLAGISGMDFIKEKLRLEFEEMTMITT